MSETATLPTPAETTATPGPEKKKKVTKPITTTIDLSNMLATAIRTAESHDTTRDVDAINSDVIGPLQMLKEHVDATRAGAHSVNQFADFYRLRSPEE